MKKLFLMFSVVCATALPNLGDMTLARILSINPGAPVAGQLPVTVSFNFRCNQDVLDVVQVSARPFSLSHPTVGVAVVLQENDSDCDPTKELKSTRKFSVDNIAGKYNFQPILGASTVSAGLAPNLQATILSPHYARAAATAVKAVDSIGEGMVAVIGEPSVLHISGPQYYYYLPVSAVRVPLSPVKPIYVGTIVIELMSEPNSPVPAVTSAFFRPKEELP